MYLKGFVLVENEGKYLLIQEAGQKWKGKWFLPGGKVRKQEGLASAARREAKEESGYDILIQGVFLVKCYPGRSAGKVCVYYTGRVISGTLKTFADKHSLTAGWFTADQMRSMSLRGKLLSLLNEYRQNAITLPEERIRVVRL